MPTITPDTIETISLVGLLAWVIRLGYTKTWVFGWQLTECEARGKAAVEAEQKRTDEWKARADRAATAAELGLEVAKERKP